MRIKLLVSPSSNEELTAAIEGHPDIIDIKNPKEGSLGANFPPIIRKAVESVRKENNKSGTSMEVSAAIGDFPNLPGTASLAALGASVLGVNYIKIGMYGIKTSSEAEKIIKSVVESVKSYNSKIKVVIAGYADYFRIGAISPLKLPPIAAKMGADLVMIDTAIKDGKTLFDNLSRDEIAEFIESARRFNLKTALAGGLKPEHLPTVKKLAPDILGVRTMVCENFDRINGKISSEMIRKIKEELKDK